ncbi:MAG: CinA family protein [Gammaproteobacteria bacterium]|nr:CinA family protein [Gammaproteobacteria bacterium]MYI89708.1 CinA family protein [Gammaproteobacteria bacterium]
MNDTIDQLVQQLSELLIKRGWMIAAVESCTGGMISESITRVPGSSVWFERGFVTYSNDAKQELVGVNSASIRDHGAVSSVVAREMAIGGVQSSRADLAVSVTGVAGPDGGTKEKPVGTVWIAWADRNGKVVDQEYLFSGDRQQVRVASAQSAFAGAIKFLNSM